MMFMENDFRKTFSDRQLRFEQIGEIFFVTVLVSGMGEQWYRSRMSQSMQV